MSKEMYVPIHKRIIVFLWTRNGKSTVKELSDMLVNEGFTCGIVHPHHILKAAMRRRDIDIDGVKLTDKEFPDNAVVTLRVTQNEK